MDVRDERPAADDAASLAARIRRGDREAFQAVVRAHQEKVFLMAYMILKDREDALDVAQETFLRLHQKIDSFRPENGFQGWLLQIARRLAIDHYRKYTRPRRENLAGVTPEEAGAAVDASPVEKASDLRPLLGRCIDRLADRQRRVFVLRHYEELQFNEISDELQISVGTAKSLHFKAVRNLKKWLTPYLGVST
jgi:RNA polymerase sigma-70 factor (ECF subfamily)